MEAVTGFRPVAINVGVRDLEEAIAFYEATFEATFEVSESRGRAVHACWRFGDGDSFFFFNLRRRDGDDPHRDHAGAFGFNVADLDGTHAWAVAAGAREHFPPVDEAGLPRHSRLQDPSGNRVVL